MKSVSKDAADFVHQLERLVQRLADKDIVVSSLKAYWSWFGCWELLAQSGKDTSRYYEELRGPSPQKAVGPEVVKLFWDGRDGILTIYASPTRYCSSPNEWKSEDAKAFKDRPLDLLQYAEDYLTKRLT